MPRLQLQRPFLPGVSSFSPASPRGAFSLAEMLVSLAMVGLLLVVLMSMINQVTAIWGMTSGKIEQFQEGREAFESITRRLANATLNTYWDYDDPSNPTRYVRQSELRFLSGPLIGGGAIAGTAPAGKSWNTHGVFFQSPLGNSEPGQTQLGGLYSLLNTRGYFVEFGDLTRPNIPGMSVVQPQYRFRLCEMIQPANELNIYQYTSGIDITTGKPKNLSYTGHDWFTTALAQPDASRPVHILADNVIALVLLPRVAQAEDSGGTQLAPAYLYDSSSIGNAANLSGTAAAQFNSKNQLPPMVQLTMVVMDEKSAKHLDHGTSTPPDLGIDFSALFQQASSYPDDLDKLERALQSRHVQYRVFTTNVRLKGAKWSKEQKN